MSGYFRQIYACFQPYLYTLYTRDKVIAIIPTSAFSFGKRGSKDIADVPNTLKPQSSPRSSTNQKNGTKHHIVPYLLEINLFRMNENACQEQRLNNSFATSFNSDSSKYMQYYSIYNI